MKRIFKKFYLPKFTEELFIVYKRLPRQVLVYKLNRYETDFIEITPQTGLPVDFDPWGRDEESVVRISSVCKVRFDCI